MAPAETLQEDAQESVSLLAPHQWAEQDFRSAKRYTKIAWECLATREFSDYAYWRSLALRLLDCALKWRDAETPSTLERVALVDIGKQKQVRIPRTARLRRSDDETDSDDAADSDGDYIEEPEIILPPMTGTFLAAIRKVPPPADTDATVTPVATAAVAPISFVGAFRSTVKVPTVPATPISVEPTPAGSEKKFSFALAFARQK